MFDEYKNNIILSNENKVLLVASQIGNNTKVLTKKLFNLIEQGINSNNILVISLNKENCENIKSEFLNKTNTSVLPYFYTFNDLFYRIVKQNLNRDVTIINESIMEEFLNSCLKKYRDFKTEYKYDFLITQINKFKNSNESINKYESNINKNFLKFIYEEYRKFKFKNGFIDSNDFSNEVLNLFISNKNVLDFYKETFKYILVDEFEKCDDTQFEILKMLSENSKLFCVGYEDKEHNTNLINDFCNIFKDGKKYYLKEKNILNYSSTKFSPNIISNNKINNDYKLLSNSLEEGEVICKNLLEKNNHINYIVDDIEYFMKKGDELSDFGVIYKNYNESLILLSEFIKRKIKVNFIDSDFNIFDEFYIQDIINLLLFIDTPNIKNFKKIYNKITFLFTEKILKLIKKYDDNTNIFKIVYENIESITLVDKRNISIIEKIIDGMGKKSLQDKMESVLNDFGYLTYLNNINKLKLINQSNVNHYLYYFYNLISRFENIQIIKEGISSINSIHGVSFGTINSFKGMEFKCLYMIDIDFRNKYLENNINIIYNKDQERKIFYIRMTKAIDKLKYLSSYFINYKFVDEPLKLMSDILSEANYSKYNLDKSNEIKKRSKSKILLYNKDKKNKVNTRDYLNIN